MTQKHFYKKKLTGLMMYNCGQKGWCQLNIGNTVNQDINHFGRHCIHQCFATSWDARTSLSDIEIFSFF